ncbi:MAG TPA: DUF2267 domain-containing protein [Streptosporangiaceae bacterium]|nr:DUF2267 domain-containing protein [Streptosporangiaceae bacterium]
MEQKVLIRAVAERTTLSREESADVTRAVLEGLADQLSDGEARRLAADLPEELAGQVQLPRRRRKGAHPVGVDDFVRQLSEHAGLTEDDARAGAGAVLAALREALSAEDYGHLVGQLPAGYTDLEAATG